MDFTLIPNYEGRSADVSTIARCYVRVSLTRAGEEKESSDTQKRDIAAWCERHGYTPEWYLDAEGYRSGRTADRPEFQRLLADLESDPTAAVVFLKVSRLARNAELAQRIHRLCQENGYHLAFVANNLDFDRVANQVQSESAAAERLTELEEKYDGLLDLAGRLDSDRLYAKIVAVEAEVEDLRSELAEPATASLPVKWFDAALAARGGDARAAPDCLAVVRSHRGRSG